MKSTFDKVFVISLPRRPERRQAFFERLPADWPFRKPVVFDAIDGGLVPRPGWWNGGDGGFGCYKSHLRILEDCLNQEIDSVFILEDDAVCVEGFGSQVRQFWKRLPDDWEMVYLGGQHTQEAEGLPRKVNEWVYRPFNVNRCHAWGLRGRTMIEKVYKFLHEYFTWPEPHHIDHRLGTFHKTAETLYVPKEWLIAQAQGWSDIAGKEVALRLFPGAVATLEPTLDRDCRAILGSYFGGVNTIAGVVSRLGLPLGQTLGAVPGTLHYHEDHALGEICRRSFKEPWLEELRTETERTAHLRRWAGLQCRDLPEGVQTICGKHPILSLMGPELVAAWNQPKFIRIERDAADCLAALEAARWRWHPSAVKHALTLLEKSRQEFFEKHGGPVLSLDYDRIKADPESAVTEICEFLEHDPTEDQALDAAALIRQTENDLCLVEQPAMKINANRND